MISRKLILPLAIASILVALGVALRLASHDGLVPPNFSAVAASALFCGFLFHRNLWVALAVPLAAMAVSDAFIPGYAWQVRIVVYAALALPALLGRAIAGAPNTSRRVLMVPLSSLAASMLFFVSTNLAEFLFGALYPRTAEGLANCFLSALPFFRYTVVGDLVFTTALFSCYAAAQSMLPILRREAAPEAVTAR